MTNITEHSELYKTLLNDDKILSYIRNYDANWDCVGKWYDLGDSFEWGETSEGHVYWAKMHDKLYEMSKESEVVLNKEEIDYLENKYTEYFV